MKDISNSKTTQVQISDDGKTLWVNTENGYVLRVSNIENLIIEDRREKTEIINSDISEKNLEEEKIDPEKESIEDSTEKKDVEYDPEMKELEE